MKQDQDPQSFADVIREADHGRIDQILSKDFADLVDYLTTKANLHEDEWEGQLSLTVKITCEPNGKVLLAFDRKTKRKEEPMPKARMYHDPDTNEVTNGPQIRLKGVLEPQPGRAPAPQARSAPAPKD